jgi:hypothetical protein
METDPEDIIAETIDNLNGLIDDLMAGELADASSKLDDIEKAITDLRTIITGKQKA